MERILTSIVAFFVFAIIGAIVKSFIGEIKLGTFSEIAFQYIPYIFGMGFGAAVLAYYFPRLFKIIMCFIPIPSVG